MDRWGPEALIEVSGYRSAAAGGVLYRTNVSAYIQRGKAARGLGSLSYVTYTLGQLSWGVVSSVYFSTGILYV